MDKQKSFNSIPQIMDQNYHLNTSFSDNSFNYFTSMQKSKSTKNNKVNNENNLLNTSINSQHNDYSKLIKSKQIMSKFNSKINQFPLKKKQYQKQYLYVKKQLQNTADEINKHLDKKIQNTFQKLLNQQSIMPISLINKQNINKKDQQDFNPNAISAIDGTRILMSQYWQKDYKNIKSKPSSQDTQKRFKQVSNLPKIHEKTYKYSKNSSKNQNIRYEKKKVQQMKSKDQQFKLEFCTFNVDITDFKVLSQTQQFLIFQRINYKKWEDIQFILNCLQKFCQHYKINHATIKLKRVLELVDQNDKIQQKRIFMQNKNRSQSENKISQIQTQYNLHQLLSCLQDAQKISQQNSKSKGIRFYGHKGKKRSIVKIQSHMRKFLAMKKYKQLRKILSKVILIQNNFRSYNQYIKTKQKIVQIQQEKVKKFLQIQKQFKQNYKRNQITKKIKYQIHISSLSLSQWQRVTAQNPNQIQNTQISRIFRIATKKTPLIEARVIYIAPSQLPQDIINYYKKVFQFGSQQFLNISDRLTILWPQNIQKLPQTLSLTQKIYYSKPIMKRLKKLTKNNYCYIVPSMPSSDFISLSCELNIPLYSSQPQKLLYLQTKAGNKQLVQVLKQSIQDGFGILPYSVNIYNKISFINELAYLIFNYPQVRRWVLKIDNQHNSQGLAYIDISKILKKQTINKLIQQKQRSSNQSKKQLKQQIYNCLHTSLIIYKQQRIIPLCKQVYKSQQQFLNHFLSYGGIIQASINNLQTDLENYCFCIQIQPNSEWKFVTSYYKLTNKNKAIGCYYDSTQVIQPPIQIQIIVKQLIKKNLFGYFTLQFLRIPQQINHKSISNTIKKSTNLIYFNGIQCYLDKFASASFLRQFLSKQSNVLYIPKLIHPSLKQLRIQTFFHLCRLENISFDMERKVGNVFMFLGGLETGCIGLMSFNSGSKEQTYQQVSDVLEFLSTKLQSNSSKKLSKCFLSIKNVVNGYLKKQKKNNNTQPKINASNSI